MLYFSELYGKKVYSEDNRYIGKIHDFLFLAAETPLITKAVIKTPNNTESISIQNFRRHNRDLILKNGCTRESVTIKVGEISLLNHLQNQQIIDINGVKVIRVNDVIVSDLPEYVISGIDVGALGVFRWIGAANILVNILRHFNFHLKSEFIPWSDIQPEGVAGGRIVLKKEIEKLKKIRPEDLAEHLEHATVQNVLKALKVMDKDIALRVIADLNLDYQTEILGRYTPEHAGQILSLIDPDQSVDVLLSLGKEKREEILPHVESTKRKEIEHLLHYAKTPIGHLMTTEFLSVPADTTVRNVIEKVRKKTIDFSEMLYVYAINNNNQVVGALNLHELLLNKPDVPLYRFMNQNLILGRLTTPKEIILRRMLKYHIYAIPIVDENRALLGIVSLQDISEDIINQYS
ncbi:hypothetical protein A3D77_06280 [Candidatus Gottesmanbacteria bacterium RIFCSPHIGHO2_02_FULL_39_11]|uniref:CBS domain-containing protein n=1 Tax=Candidatus Gottesmanbacteria bacterium RIFCSPHIGHO2_02_FULL_39_11 TaxID=1798382 RepID=A0A1F5ZX24_9BACT|nr:MAG: hypothetical protein A3D77_06280 [Candidatus Gottesmanbacteria bacterium RIFCSPHIGHO2_02_FULL_39_11]